MTLVGSVTVDAICKLYKERLAYKFCVLIKHQIVNSASSVVKKIWAIFVLFLKFITSF